MKSRLVRIFLLIALALVLGLFLPYLVAHASPPAQGGPPPIPHAKEGRTDCLACHEKGLSGARKVPPDHAGRTNEMCVACHQVKPGAPAAGGTPAPSTSGTIPTIPHIVEGREQCLACHQAGIGGAPKVPTNHAGRTNEQCRTCHQAKVLPPVVVPTRVASLPNPTNQNTCAECHTTQGGASAEIVAQHVSSVHAARGVQCVACHGGDATKKVKEEAKSKTAGYVGKPKTAEIPALCASCHARVELMRQYDLATDQYSQYQVSVHGIQLAQGDNNVATCFVCHDGHATKEVNDPSSNVYPQNVPALCARCHSNTQLMQPYSIPTNQFDLYRQSVHGIALLQRQDPRAPSCATCHGTHGAAPPGFSEVANVCGSCHSATQDYFLKSQHASNAPGTPKCVTCHGRYDVGPASEAMFADSGTRGCRSCHAPNSPQAATIQQLADAITTSAKAYDDATLAIQRAAGTGLIVAPEQAKLADAKTNLITARAAQHTLGLDTVKEKTTKATDISKQVQANAEKAIGESVIRRQAMVIGLFVAAIAIGSLYLIRRELYRQLPPKA
ncbi:MAG: cytochrome c3 family protein [Chloroflexi bacterium]|nr:cytochrome c3 family protein [Chloroflexota bacterium]